MDAEIVVKGSGRVLVMPDRAVLRVGIDGDAGSREEAYRQAAPLAQAVDAVIEHHRDDVDRVVAAALMVHPKTRWRKGESVRTGWRASRSTILEVTGLDHLGELVSALTTAGGAITGPTWQVDRDNQAFTEARRLAAGDARRRATAYAEALGVSLGPVAWVSEPGLRAGESRSDTHYAMAAPAGALRGSAAADEEIIAVAPDEIPVDAAVEVGFTFTERNGDEHADQR